MAGSSLCLELEALGSLAIPDCGGNTVPSTVFHGFTYNRLKVAPLAPDDPQYYRLIRLSHCTLGVQEIMPLLIQCEKAFVAVYVMYRYLLLGTSKEIA